MDINYLTRITIWSLKRNGHFQDLKMCESVNELKKKIGRIYFKDEPVSDSFKKGAKTINWEAVLEATKL